MDTLTGLFSVPGASGGGGGGSWLSKVLPWVQLGTGVSGTVGNITANAARNKVLSEEMRQMGILENLTPAQIVSGITSLEQPLSKNLINSVSNATQGELASRGLSQAPGIYASALAQGLAPYQLQEQQLAQNAFFQKLGLPISARPSPFGPYPQTTNTSQIWQSLIQRFMNPNAGTLPANTSAATLDNILFPTNLLNLQTGSLPLDFTSPGLAPNPLT